MVSSPLVEQLIEALCCFPGVGQKSAQRMALYILEKNRDEGKRLADALQKAITSVGHCQNCRNLCESSQCTICSNPRRNQSLVCVVESPADVFAIEQSGLFQGIYFVLMGHLSPIDGIGPQELGIGQLKTKLENESLEELILATNPTVEGETTAHYIAELAKSYAIKTTRIAHGVPFGGELEYIDSGTLAHAFAGRLPL